MLKRLSICLAIFIAPELINQAAATQDKLQASQKVINDILQKDLKGTSGLFTGTNYAITFEKCQMTLSRRTSVGIVSKTTSYITSEISLKNIIAVNWRVASGLMQSSSMNISFKTRENAVIETGKTVNSPFMKASKVTKKWSKKSTNLAFSFGFDINALRYSYPLLQAFKSVVLFCSGSVHQPKPKLKK